jgi:outer membrane immunogenic protein
MKRLLLASVGSTMLSLAAMAADVPAPAYVNLPPPPQFSWTGLYLGGNAGWGSLQDNGLPFCLDFLGAMQGPGCDIVTGGQTSGSGFVGGGQVGYNWQAGRLVLGLETDFQGTNIKSSTNVAGPFEIIGFGPSGPGASFVASEKLSWLGTLRGRFGVAFDRVMIYAVGGFAYGEVSVSQAHNFPLIQYASNTSRMLNGWTFGGGVEWAFLGNWSARAEGMFYDLGSISTSSPGLPLVPLYYTLGKNFDAQGVIIRGGLNFRFGEPVAVAYAPAY